MRHEIIKTHNYLLVVDESVKEINNGEYFLLGGKHVNMWAGSGTRIMTDVTGKIISHAPLNGAPYLDPVDVLPPSWRDSGDKDDVEQLAEEHAEHQFKGISDRTSMFECKNDFKSGYQEAREKYKFTEEDLRNAFYNGWLYRGEQEYQYPKAINEFIQSIRQAKLPVAFECEMKQRFEGDKSKRENPYNGVYYTPITIINSEGRIEWVGKYIYN